MRSSSSWKAKKKHETPSIWFPEPPHRWLPTGRDDSILLSVRKDTPPSEDKWREWLGG